MKFWKDLLPAGEFTVGGQRYVFTEADIQQMLRNGDAALQKRQPIPVGWEHHPDLVAMSAAKSHSEADRIASRSKFYTGPVEGFRLSPDDPTMLQVLVDAKDDEADRVQRVGFVSPGLVRDWTTGDGTRYPGWSVAHVAVTAQPVNNRQGGFVPLSLPANLVCLSLSDKEDPKVNDDTKPDDDTPAAEPKEEKPEETPDEPKEPVIIAPGGPLKDAVELATQLGLVMGDDTSEATFLDRFVVAARTFLATRDVAATTDPADPGTAPDDAQPVPVGTGGVQMSSAHSQRLLQLERDELARRIQGLTASGRILPVVEKDLLNQLNSVNLSLTTEAKIAPCKLLDRLEAYEALPEQSTEFSGQSRVNLSQANVIARPPDGPPRTKEEAAKSVDGLLELANGKKARK
jgi:hypothetical protein